MDKLTGNNLMDNSADAYEWVAEAAGAGERLDKHIADQLEGEAISRTQAQEWIKSGHALVNGKIAKANYKVQPGDAIAIELPEPELTEALPEPIPLHVVYEDADVIVINKPRGMVVHPALGHYSGTVVNALLYHCKGLAEVNGTIRPGIVHRIDKDTTGLIVAAKSSLAHASLSEQLKEHTVTRRYIALAHGNIEHSQGTVDAPIGRDPHDRKLFVVTARNSKSAVTHFAVLERFGDYTLLELKLETGRTHQIRVHMKYIGHPLAGDPAYGRSKTIDLNGQALHAAVLGFAHPRSGEYMEFTADLPLDFQQIIDGLRQR